MYKNKENPDVSLLLYVQFCVFLLKQIKPVEWRVRTLTSFFFFLQDPVSGCVSLSGNLSKVPVSVFRQLDQRGLLTACG